MSMQKKTAISIRHFTLAFVLSLFTLTLLMGLFVYANTPSAGQELIQHIFKRTFTYTLLGLFALQILATVVVFVINDQLLVKPLRNGILPRINGA